MRPAAAAASAFSSLIAIVMVLVAGMAGIAGIAACAGEIRLTSADAGAADGAASTSSSGCTGDGECLGSHCDLVTATCVACLRDEHCTSDRARRCDVALHRCVECGVAGDCTNGMKCETTTRRCVPSCDEATKSSCPSSAPTCDLARGICVPCTTGMKCTEEHAICDVAGGRCVECLNDSQCEEESKRRCDPLSGRCVACLSSLDCPLGDEHTNVVCTSELQCSERRQ